MTNTVIYPNAMVILTTKRQHLLSLSRKSKIILNWEYGSCIPFVEHIFYKPGNDVPEEAYRENTFGNIADLHPAHSFKETSYES